MQGMAATLKPDDMKARWASTFRSRNRRGCAAKDANARDRGTEALPRRRYRVRDAGVRRVSLAHDGAGIPKNYPRLAGQYAEYTYAQLKAFRDGERGADKEGKDYNGKIMATVAARMSDPQMKALAELHVRRCGESRQGLRRAYGERMRRPGKPLS